MDLTNFVKHGRLANIARPIANFGRELFFHTKAKSEAYDKAWKNLNALLVEDVICHIPAFGLDFQIDPRSRLFARLLTSRDYEPEVAELVRSLVPPAKDAIDIGANAGFFTCMLAKIIVGRRVLAIEPTQGALTRLKANILRHGLSSNVELFEGVASDSMGEIQLSLIEGQEEFSSIGKITHPSAKGTMIQTTVRSVTLDSLVSEHALEPGFIKIDTEGAEALVFKGAKETLERYHPIIVSELSDPLLRSKGSSAKEVVSSLEAFGYTVTDPFHPELQAGTRPYGDILAIYKGQH